MIDTIGVLESRIGGSVFWILPGLWVSMDVATPTREQYLQKMDQDMASAA